MLSIKIAYLIRQHLQSLYSRLKSLTSFDNTWKMIALSIKIAYLIRQHLQNHCRLDQNRIRQHLQNHCALDKNRLSHSTAPSKSLYSQSRSLVPVDSNFKIIVLSIEIAYLIRQHLQNHFTLNQNRLSHSTAPSKSPSDSEHYFEHTLYDFTGAVRRHMRI